jgi:hypothetical protein
MRFEIDGYTCEQVTEYEEDNYKEFHFVVSPDGERHFLNHTPYEDMGREDFAHYVRFHQKWGYMPERREVETADGRWYDTNWDNEHLPLMDLEIRG